MSFDDEFGEYFDDGSEYGKMQGNVHQDGLVGDAESPREGFGPVELSDPKSAYFFLSDDAQDEIAGIDCKKMKCRRCEHRFWGDDYDNCPKCNSFETEAFFRDMVF